MIVLYGATGYTGRLVTDELVRRGLDFTLAGRNPEKLARLSEERGQGAPVRTATVDDPRSLRAMLDDCDVVINCAGPFSLYGEPVVEAAVETRTHYLDSTGEQTFMKRVFDQYGRRAKTQGVAVVPAMGFDYLPGDCIARLAAAPHEPLEELVLAYAMSGFGASQGTLLSALEMLKGGDFVYTGGNWKPAPIDTSRRTFDFPGQVGRQAMIRYPSGEVLTVPRHTRTRKVTSLIGARAFVPLPALAPVLPLTMPAVSLALRTPLQRVLGKAVGRLPEGPEEADRRAARFTIVALARGADGGEGRGVVRGSDPYGLTAVTLVHGAERMSGDGYAEAGVLAPAEAYDPESFLNYLTDHDLSWELDRPAVPA